MLLSLEDQAKIAARLKRTRNFNKFADDLALIINDLWEASSLVGVDEVNAFLKASGKFSKSAADDVARILRQSLRDDFGSNLRPVMQEAASLGYSIGSNEIRRGLVKNFSLIDRRAIKFLHEHHMYWSLEHYDSHVTQRIKRLSDTAIKQGLSRRDAGKFFKNTIGEELQRSESYWRLTADAISTRARSFGALEAFEKLEIEEYRIDAVIDHRTSEICEYLDGKTFKVSKAVETRDAMLEAKTPDEAKEISPWLKPEEVVDQKIDDLQDQGVNAPPFHGNCRSRLVIV